MGREIERKFLVRDGAPLSGGQGAQLRQGYILSSGEGEVRLRDADGQYTLTVKTGRGLERAEWEVDLTVEQFEVLWPATAGRRLEKRRVALDVGDLTYELDRYEGELRGLVVVEVEFDSLASASAFLPPRWFGREVTGDVHYSNASLALTGPPEDEEPEG